MGLTYESAACLTTFARGGQGRSPAATPRRGTVGFVSGTTPALRVSLPAMVRFTRDHLPYVLWLPALGLWGTFMHEGAHAIAAVIQGATLTRFHIMPGWDLGYFTFGYMSYDAPSGGLDGALVSVAPVLGAVVTATLGAIVIGRFGREHWHWKSAYIFVYLLPLVDASMAVSGLFARRRASDLYKALAGHEAPVAVAAVVLLALATWRGWPLFVRTCGRVLSPAEHALGFLAITMSPWLTRIILHG